MHRHPNALAWYVSPPQRASVGYRQPNALAWGLVDLASDDYFRNPAMSLVKPIDPPKTSTNKFGGPSPARPDRRVVWEWNLPLLIVSASVVVVVSILLVTLYFWQSQRLATGLLQRATAAEQAGDTEEQIRWLKRYVGLAPDDVEAQIKLALSVDSQVSTAGNLEETRRRLNAALIACGENPAYEQQKHLLRTKLIQRLLQFGPRWATEAQRQVLALNAQPGDPEATKWLAQALVLQQGDSIYQKPSASQHDRQQDPWGWLAEQPLGEVLSIALEANPDDVDLAAVFLGAWQSHREWFDAADKPADSQRIEELAQQLVQRLQQQTDNGRAQLVAYAHLQAADAPEAASVIQQAAEPALNRLAAHFEAPAEAPAEASAAKLEKKQPTPASDTALMPLSPASPPLSQTAYQPYWDWQLVAEAARLFAIGQDQPRAKELYGRLLACDSDAIQPTMREAIYVAYGSLLATSEGIPAAIEKWQEGIDKLPESLELTRMLASAFTSQQNLAQAQSYVDQYQAIISSQRDRLDGSYGAELTMAAKQSIRLRLDSASWEVLLFQARLALADNKLVAASDLSLKAFTSPLVLDKEQRLQAGRLLADCYARRELWDMAGQTLDRCISLAPNDAALRRSAAMAWRSAGITERANRELVKLDDGSFEAALEAIQQTLTEQTAKPAEQMDWSTISQAIELARRRYEQASANERASMKLWRLELLELQSLAHDLPPAESTQLRLDRLEQIALANPPVSEVQMLAAANLAASGRPDAAQLAVDRLQQLAMATGQSRDKANVALIRANLLAGGDDMPAAIETIQIAMRDLPDQQLQLAKSGADAAIRGKQPQLAYNVLRKVPEDQLDTQALFTLCIVAQALQASNPAQAPKLREELENWTNKLRTTEGPEGTHWRYLEAQQLLLSSSANSAKRQEQLDQATRLFNEIDARRPHWGRAAALGGQIASQQGFPDEALTLLRRAVNDGDRQISTLWSLVQLLKAAGRIDEASQVLASTTGDGSSFLPVSAMLVDLAQLHGDFDGAVTKARELSQEQSQEYTSWLLLADAALKSASRPGATTDEKQARLEEGWQALEKAHELSQGKEVQVWDARFRFKLASADRPAAEQVLAELQKSKLDDETRLLAAGRGYLQLNDFEKARKLFEACLAVNAKSTAAYLSLADLYNRMGDPTASLDALRHAHQASPQNQQLRERLAMALAFSEIGRNSPAGEHAAEIDTLLSSTDANSAPRTRLVKAFIDLSKGNATQQEQALLTMRDVARVGGVEGTDAKRMLANHYATKWLTSPSQSDSTDGRRNFDEAIAFHRGLTDVSAPNALDVARYCDFLLKAFTVERDAGRKDAAQARLDQTQLALQKLQALSGSSIASLQLSVRLALAQGNQAKIQSIAENWVKAAGALPPLGQQQVWELAGRTLDELGMTEDAIAWLEKVYHQDPSKYQHLVMALAKAQQIERAIILSVTGYKDNPSAESASLLAEVAMLLGKQPAPDGVEQTLRDALTKFSDSPQFLEAFATVRLMQERFQEAAAGFEAVEKIAPGRVRTLNNWAMALSEIPMGKELALQKIEKAVAVHGRFPELLDTLGLVLLHNGRLDEAQRVFSEAADKGNDPRFHLHLAQVAIAQGDTAAAHSVWQKIDKAKLNDLTLTSAEQAVRTQLESSNQQESL